MKIKATLFFILIFMGLYSQTTVETYFKNTDYELNVYNIHGAKAGKTLMIIGGIQGDESGGYLSADLFVDMALEQGNLIIIPRANIPTIIKNLRQVNKDMNRRFDEAKTDIFEDAVVEVLKLYMQKSDFLLNLHEGGGFYRSEYIDATHNQMKFGQCIIADADSFFTGKHNKTLYLRDFAQEVCDNINPLIEEEAFHFRFNNHNTISPKTAHIEQRKSATYYALTQAQIPAFGVEVSKQLPSLELKIKFHKMIIKEFMRLLDIKPDYPLVDELEPKLDYIVLLINGKRVLAEPSESLIIPENSEVSVQLIQGNVKRGFLADIVGVGTMNDMGKSFIISKSTTINLRKDNKQLTRINLNVDKTEKLAVRAEYQGIKIMIDNVPYEILPEKTLTVDTPKTIQVVGSLNDEKDLVINFVGYANLKGTPDDKGYIIHTPEDLIPKYSLNNGTLWEIDVYKNHKIIAKHYINFNQNAQYKLQYTLNQKSYTINTGDTLFCKTGDLLYIEKALIGDRTKKDIKINIAGYISNPKKDGDDQGEKIELKRKDFIDKFKISHNLFEIQINQKEVRLATFYLEITNDER